MSNFYEAIGLHADDKPEVLDIIRATKKARALLGQVKPVTFKINEQLLAIDQAYNALINPVTRSEYDKKLAEIATKKTHPKRNLNQTYILGKIIKFLEMENRDPEFINL